MFSGMYGVCKPKKAIKHSAQESGATVVHSVGLLLCM